MDLKKIKNEENELYKIVRQTVIDLKSELTKELVSNFPEASIKFVKDVPYSWIKDTLEEKGTRVHNIAIKTDKGKTRKAYSDGGIVYINIFNIKIPIAWYELKSSNSSSKHGVRGQATGLISEQNNRCKLWTSIFNTQLKPLVAIMVGSDFNKDLGLYNIQRISDDLFTNGNCNPYEENNVNNTSWFFYSENFSNEELRKIVKETLETNFYKALNLMITHYSYYQTIKK